MTLARRLGRLEALVAPTPRAWIEDPDDGLFVCQGTGERITAEDAHQLGAGDIVARCVDDWRGHEPGT